MRCDKGGGVGVCWRDGRVGIGENSMSFVENSWVVGCLPVGMLVESEYGAGHDWSRVVRSA